jgi:hypothetical protein
MVLCPPRCGKPGSNKNFRKAGRSASGEGLAAHLFFYAGVHQVGASPSFPSPSSTPARPWSAPSEQINVLDGFDGSGWSKADAI